MRTLDRLTDDKTETAKQAFKMLFDMKLECER